MRFMLFMIPNVSDEEYEKGPSVEDVEAMMKYNEELTKAGVLLALDGLHPPSMGARVTFAGGKPTVTDGPFAEAKEVLGGYWMIQVKSKEEAIEWAQALPARRRARSSRSARCRRSTDFPRGRPEGRRSAAPGAAASRPRRR